MPPISRYRSAAVHHAPPANQPAPLPRCMGCRVAVFGLFPVVLGLGLTWLYAFIFTAAGVYDGAAAETQVLHGGEPASTASLPCSGALKAHHPDGPPCRPPHCTMPCRKPAPPTKPTLTTSFQRLPGSASPTPASGVPPYSQALVSERNGTGSCLVLCLGVGHKALACLPACLPCWGLVRPRRAELAPVQCMRCTCLHTSAINGL